MANPILRRLTDTLGLLNRGRFSEKCDEHLAAALETLKALPSEKGSAAITITIKLAYESGRIDIVPEVKSKLPEEKAFAANAFWECEGGLSVQHPSQMDLYAGPEDAENRMRRREAAEA